MALRHCQSFGESFAVKYCTGCCFVVSLVLAVTKAYYTYVTLRHSLYISLYIYLGYYGMFCSCRFATFTVSMSIRDIHHTNAMSLRDIYYALLLRDTHIVFYG